MAKNNNTVPGSELRALLARYSLQGDEAARIAGEILGLKMETIQQYYKRTISLNNHKLLEFELAKRYGK